MTSVILPTIRWTPSAEAVVDALGTDDELLVVCDSTEDPVATDAPDRATIVVAGEPEGCSGKAHALATAMERATDDIVVWTDDDVPREGSWLNRLVNTAKEHGVATEVPVFVGGGLWRLFEPAILILGTTGTAAGNHVWGGGVAFDRTTLDEEEFLTDLRQTLGDDSLLSEYVDTERIRADTDHVREISVGGTPRVVYDRIVRFAKTAAFFDPKSTVVFLLLYAVLLAGSVAVPLLGVGLATLVMLLGVLAYAKMGVRSPNALLSVPSVVLTPPALLLGVAMPTFQWGSRAYKWWGKFDVTVVSQTDTSN